MSEDCAGEISEKSKNPLDLDKDKNFMDSLVDENSRSENVDLNLKNVGKKKKNDWKNPGIDEFNHEETILLQKEIEGLFYNSFHPQYLDLCTEFADSEEFIVDGDALLAFTLQKEGIVINESDEPDLSRLSSLHIIYLLEKSLSHFQERGGVFSMIFFERNRSSWIADTLLLLRTLTILHFSHNTEIKVHTNFTSPFHKNFKEFVTHEKPCFILSSLQFTEDLLFFLQYQNLGVNFAELSQMTKTLVNISCWYSMNTPQGSAFDACVHSLFSKLEEENKPLEDECTDLGRNQVLNNVDGPQRQQFVMRTLEESLSTSQCTRSMKIVMFSMIVGDVLKNHMGLRDRIEVGMYYSLDAKKGSSLPEHANFLHKIILKNINNACAQKLSDTLDMQFLLKIIHVISMNCGMTMLEILAKEIGENNEIAKDFENLSINTLGLDFLAPLDFQDHEFTAFNILANGNCSQPKKMYLQQISNPLYEEYTRSVLDEETVTLASEQHESRHKIFEEKYHWHTMKKLTDDFDRTKPKKANPFNRRMDQKNANFMVRYGISIEGSVEIDKPIVAQANGKRKDDKKSMSVLKTQREVIGQKFNNEKSELDLKYGSFDENCPINKLQDFVSFLENRKHVYINELKIIGDVKEKKNHQNVKRLEEIISDYFQELLTKLLIKILKMSYKLVKNNKGCLSNGTIVDNLLIVKKILQYKTVMSDRQKDALSKLLEKMGFPSLTGNMDCSEDQEGSKKWQSLTRFQLEHMGSYMEHESPDEKDRRVDKFNPDLWQRELFDAVDKRESALVIAPTSSGKTYASYYCMESVLRESDEGVVVYVSPTKALVNQVAATVCARFSKRKNVPRGQTVYGVFTRDFRENALNCQILVTVPECLEILLLSPERPEWVQKLRYVIFDEVHNIGAETRGEYWEHIMTLIRCPFLALSATVQNPNILHEWLQKAENFKKERDLMDGVVRKSYRVKLVPSKGRIERHADLKKHVFNSDQEERLVPLHPIANLKSSVVIKQQSFPDHLTMSPKECLEVLQALEKMLGKEDVKELFPSHIFGEVFLKKKDIKEYNDVLKEYILHKLSTDKGPKFFEDLKHNLSPTKSLNNEDHYLSSEEAYLKGQFCNLVNHLKGEGMLPALVFTFNRKYCQQLTGLTSQSFQNGIDKLKISPEYQRKEKEKEKSKQAGEKAIKKLKAKMDKIETNNKKDNRSIASHLCKLEDISANPDMEDEGTEALSRLGSVFRKFPEHTLVSKNTLGDQDAQFIMDRLKDCLDPLFMESLQYGISWHHAGNNARMRNATEMLFREKFLNLVVATTTLSQGIHMPCKTVVFAGDSVFLNSLNYHQCSGRAGRRGFDQDGHIVFFGIKSSKISRLLTANLPLLIGNNPTSISLILRLFIMTAERIQGQTRRDMLSRALCLLENPLIGCTNPKITTQLKFFFMYCSEYLSRQNLINTKGNPVGFAGLASHLHYHEPYNLAFCHLLETGLLHSLCSQTEQGIISQGTMEELLVLISFLFARRKLHFISYQKTKKSFKNSKVLLPKLSKTIQQSLGEFNEKIDENFENYLNSASKIFKEAGQDATLPLSGLTFKLGHKEMSSSYSLISPFSLLSGKSNIDMGKDEIKVMNSNIKAELLTDTIPKVDLEDHLNSYALDFFNHGIYKSLVTDNGLQEGEAFNLLNDFMLVLKTISTSLTELGPDPDEEEDLLIKSVKQLSDQFQEKFENSFPSRKFLPRGCQVIHPSNCEACKLMLEGSKVECISRENRVFTVKGRFTCESSWIVFCITCLDCKIQCVGTSVSPFASKMKEIMSDENSSFSKKHKNHEICASIVDGSNSGNFKELNTKKIEWISKLLGRDFDNR